MPKGVQGKWTEGVEKKSNECQNEICIFLEGPIVNHVCVKGLNNYVNSFCTEVEKHVLDHMTDISYYNTNTSLCSKSATIVLKIVYYMNVVSSRDMPM